MKQSRYNFFYKLENEKYIAFNALKNGLAVVGSKTVTKVLSLKPGDNIEVEDNLRDELVKGGFICEDDLDEFSTLVIRKNMQQYIANTLGLVIAPTLACNLACIYCFESPSQGIMDEPVMEGLVTFVKKYIDYGLKNIDITWYGGEPLLGLGVIEKLSERFIALCEENKINYSAYIITNGTLYTKETVEKLKNMKVRGAQITLDGDKIIHDQRRPFKNGKGTFEQIIKNIRETAGILPIGLRVNVDKTNIDQTLSFFENLKKEEWFSSLYGKMISISYGHVQKYTNSCRCSKEETLKDSDFWQKEIELHRYLNKNGYGFNLYPSVASGCTATSMNSYLVGPGGELYKCWNHTGEPENVIGSIFKPIELNSKHVLYLTESFEQDQECRECKYLPICMGGCVDIRVKVKKGMFDSKNCAGWKYYLEDALREYYTAKMQPGDKQNSEK